MPRQNESPRVSCSTINNYKILFPRQHKIFSVEDSKLPNSPGKDFIWNYIYPLLKVVCHISFHTCLPFHSLLFCCYIISVRHKMTILIEQPDLALQSETKNVHAGETNELVFDGGFPLPKQESEDGFKAPEINSFGHTFRNYDAESERQKGVEEFYRQQHINQTYDFVKRMRKEYGKLDKAEMSIWECCELLNEVVDESDPDLDEPQIQHLLQSAEAIRKDYPDEDWLHLTALIHDLGKILLLPRFGELPQWAVVGDTFPLGCAFDESNVHHKYFKENPDNNCPAYNTKNGIYTEGYGLDNVVMSWGHDDYMYMVAKENGTTLPSAGLFIIRYHSFYPLHKEGAYTHLMNEEDVENLKWLKIFNKYDLYSKSKVLIDVEKVKPYYLSLTQKYFPAKLRW
ncbi:hypothetical protein VNO77_00346 [Canavalia gladiata]|uniref:Inositol oxygenase n=1 Tax=Canavalia gladiata TaxID=3824 RepID=A0AAN9MVP2_CANGL